MQLPPAHAAITARLAAAAQRLAGACPRGPFLLPPFAPAPSGGQAGG